MATVPLWTDSNATENDTRMAELPAYPGTPRWVRVFGIIALAVVLLLVIMMLTGGDGGHGPGRNKPSSAVTEHGAQHP